MFEVAKKYILSVLLQNEELEKFPQDFISASLTWIRSWFLKDDSVTEKIVDSQQPETIKQAVIEAKLEELLKNTTFVQELSAQLNEYSRHKTRIKNVIDETSSIEAEGSISVGDKGVAGEDDYDQKNIVKGKIKAGKDVNIGDRYYHAGDNFGTVSNYFQHSSPDAPPPVEALAGLKEDLRNFVAKGNTGEAIDKLVKLNGPEVFKNTTLQLSGRWEELNRQKRQGVLNTSEINLERARIDVAVLELIEEM